MQKFLMILKKIKYYRVISLALVAVLLVIGFILIKIGIFGSVLIKLLSDDPSGSSFMNLYLKSSYDNIPFPHLQ